MRLIQQWRRFDAGETTFIMSPQGNAAVEFAFLIMFFVVVALGAFDFGRYAMESSEVTQAARAGTQFAVLNQANATDTASIIQAARNEAEDLDNSLGITTRNYCVCPESSAEVNCANTCADGQFAPLYVEVSVTNNDFDLLFHYPGVPDNITLNSVSTMRVR